MFGLFCYLEVYINVVKNNFSTKAQVCWIQGHLWVGPQLCHD